MDPVDDRELEDRELADFDIGLVDE